VQELKDRLEAVIWQLQHTSSELNQIVDGDRFLICLKSIAKSLDETKSRCMNIYIRPHLTDTEIMEWDPRLLNLEDGDEDYVEWEDGHLLNLEEIEDRHMNRGPTA
jgi:hypothetical protein